VVGIAEEPPRQLAPSVENVTTEFCHPGEIHHRQRSYCIREEDLRQQDHQLKIRKKNQIRSRCGIAAVLVPIEKSVCKAGALFRQSSRLIGCRQKRIDQLTGSKFREEEKELMRYFSLGKIIPESRLEALRAGL
jgi:hypothetical protein